MLTRTFNSMKNTVLQNFKLALFSLFSEKKHFSPLFLLAAVSRLSKKQKWFIAATILIIAVIIGSLQLGHDVPNPVEVLPIIDENQILEAQNINNMKIVREILAHNVIHGPYSNATERPLIVYAYHETRRARANLLFFLRHGVHGSADFIFIVNGPSDISDIFPKNATNIEVIKRNNTCYDLGAFGEILRSKDYQLVKKYQRFILMNSSIRGPFFPKWAKDECWSEKFLNRLNERVKLVGMSHNCVPVRHVQSMIIATDRIGLNILLSGNASHNLTRNLTADEEIIRMLQLNPFSLAGLSSCYQTFPQAVSAELSLTNLIYNASYEVDVLMTASVRENYYSDCKEGNPLIQNGYFGASLHPYETIFTKVNKEGYDGAVVDSLTTLHNEWGVSSWNSCARP